MSHRSNLRAARRIGRRAPALALASVALLAAAAPLAASTVKVSLTLPVRAGLDLEGRRSLAALPFIVVRQEGEGPIRARNSDVQRELLTYLVRVLRRDTELKIVPVEAVDYPSFDLKVLSRDQPFWQAVAARNQADLVLVGSVDFDVQDRSGYRMEEYVSPFDGRTYYRQVLVEQTGFEFDILMQVYDGDSGKLIHEDNFKDFKTLEGADATDPVDGMFRNLYAFEDRMTGIFVQRRVEATRTLFNP